MHRVPEAPVDLRQSAASPARRRLDAGLGLGCGTNCKTVCVMNPELRTLIDRVIVPALLEHFLRDQKLAAQHEVEPELPKTQTTV
jgi:hypothetical protein